MGADFIGFRIDQTHGKYVDLANYNEITNWIAGIGFIGESSIITEQTSVAYNVDQLLIDNVELLSSYIGNPALWSIGVNNLDDHTDLLNDHASKIAGLILTSDNSQVSESDKIQIKNISIQFDIYLSYGINHLNVIQLINELPIKGVSLKGSDEIRPGYKDYDELADILEQLQEDN
jgi:phosphoribosylanthranilate isomerase